ncbi:uncharacterized protein TNCV_773711 [Trichonephila clavipes]|nr:uncharacterized protein TNCV_773711 [Trichonephila clavipes]
MRLMEGEERWEAFDHPQGVFPLNWGGTEPNRTVTCMVLKAMANDRHTTSSLEETVNSYPRRASTPPDNGSGQPPRKGAITEAPGGKSLRSSCQVIYSQFGSAIHQNDHQARRRFVEWAQNEIAVVPDFHKRILFSDEAHFWWNGYVNKQNCRIWSEANPQVYVETPLHPEKLTVWCALWAGGILLQKR